jgi:hypothetical protein
VIVVKAYLYPNTAEVQVFDPSIYTVRNRVVYSRPIKVYQGIDNPIQVLIRNQDQKAVDLTGFQVTASIQDPTNKVTLMDYPVIFDDITKGLGNFTLDQGLLDTLEQRFYKLTFRRVRLSDSLTRPLYIDDNYGVPLDLEILPAFYTPVSGGGSGGGGGGGGYIP